MKKVITKDGSETFYNEKYQEHYHSTAGALQEAFEKYVRPSRLFDGCAVLDICFGIGYNSLAAVHFAIENNLNISIVALENDFNILKLIKTINMDKKYSKAFEIIKNVAEKLEYEDKKIKIKLVMGDARETIKKLNHKFDFVFLDPFSTKKCPELWTEEFMKDIYNVMNKGLLTTYSCAKTVRDNLRKVGFDVKNGPCVGRKAPSTLAYKN